MPRSARVRVAVDLLLAAAITLILLRIFLRPTYVHAYPFPVGPDLPVYLWWSRIGVAEGLSAAGFRPGVTALIPTLQGLLGIGAVPAVAGIQYAMGPAIGLAAAGLLRGRGEGPRLAWVTGGVLAGVFATYLGSGYVSNLVFAAGFVAAAAMLARRTLRGTVAAALLLGSAGLAHPQFFVVGAVIMVVTAGWSHLLDRHETWHSDSGRVLGALVGGAAIVGLGLLSLLAGPAPLGVDTSKDGFLRRTGQWATLRTTYLDRFRHNRPRYAVVVTMALGAVGALTGHGFRRRFLLAWAGVTLVALPIGILTTWFPPDRVATFAFCLPMLAALGIAWIGERIPVAWIGWVLGVGLVVLLTIPAVRSWDDQGPIVSPDELTSATIAGRIASLTPEGTPLVFVTESTTDSGLFQASHAANVARAAVPPERIRDVYVFLGRSQDLLAGRPTIRGNDELHDRASQALFDDLPKDVSPAVFVLRDFDDEHGALRAPGLFPWDVGVSSTVPDPRPLSAGIDELRASSPAEMSASARRTLALLVILGLGWGLWALGDLTGAALSSAAFGLAALTLTAFVTERAGLDPTEPAAAGTAAVLAGGLGYALWAGGLVRDRRRRGREA